jgi:carboxymethylenebutenolidase
MVQLESSTMGYVTKPQGDGPKPGVIIVHEITGLNDQLKEVADNFAARGFATLAVDFFEGVTPAGMQDGAPIREKITEPVFRTKIGAGIQYLKSQSYCNGRLGVTGFCMGGGFALWSACLYPDDIQACSMFYGRIGDLGLLQNLKGPVIGNFGGDDAGITAWAGSDFWPEMVKLGKSLDMKVYPGAPHGFARHTDPKAYRPEAATDAFERTYALFDKALRA